MKCRRCHHKTDSARMFCGRCGAILERGALGMRISTEHTRGRALEELDRNVGLYDSDERAADKEREFQSG